MRPRCGGRPNCCRVHPVDEVPLELEEASEFEAVVWDYRALGLTLRSHPMLLLRPQMDERRFATAADLADAENGDFVRYVGIVTLRQQPETAKGVIFVSLEDDWQGAGLRRDAIPLSDTPS